MINDHHDDEYDYQGERLISAGQLLARRDGRLRVGERGELVIVMIIFGAGDNHDFGDEVCAGDNHGYGDVFSAAGDVGNGYDYTAISTIVLLVL